MEFLKNIAFVSTQAMALSILLMGCSAIPIKMSCTEIQARMDYDNLTGDQLRFAQDELKDCRGQQKQAEARDSSFIEGTEKRFTPESAAEPEPDSGQADGGKDR